MRIAIIVPSLNVGGAETMAARLALSLRRDPGVDVLVISLFLSSTTIAQQLQSNGVRVVFLNKKLGFDFTMPSRLQAEFRKFLPDVVHTHQYVLRYVLPGIVVDRIPTVHTIHTLPKNEMPWLGRFINGVAFYTGVVPVAVGQTVAELFCRTYVGTRARIIRNGIDLTPFRPECDRHALRREHGISDSTIVIACPAQLRPEKNHVLLVDAFARTAAVCPDTQLLLIGEGPERASIERAIADRQLGNRVRLMGFREDVAHLLRLADVGVVASRYEGTPLSVMEMMAAGLPVVAFDVGGIPDLIDDDLTGVLVRPNESIRMSDALTRMMLNVDRRCALGRMARLKAFREFGLDYMTNEYKLLYKKLISSRSCRNVRSTA